MSLPPLDEPLDQLGHSLIEKARSAFSDDRSPRERIVSIDDNVFLKVKVGRWRGAVWGDTDTASWLCAAGIRREGSPEDFYAALVSECRRRRQLHNANSSPTLKTETFSDHLLPQDDDHKRLALEEALRASRVLDEVVPQLVATALFNSDEEQHGAVAGYRLGVLVHRDDLDEIYISIRIVGSVSTDAHAVILSKVPGADLDAWSVDMPPHRDPQPGEVTWSTLLDPAIVEKLM
jgi:hypothetical protein